MSVRLLSAMRVVEESMRRCCVRDIGECEDWADGGWPWLEAGGEFVEGGANPIMQGQLGRKLVVAASQVLYEGVPG
jgi:hypothetical protein